MEGLLTALCDLARTHIVRGHVVTRSSTTVCSSIVYVALLA
jgi:hypothetical protein